MEAQKKKRNHRIIIFVVIVIALIVTGLILLNANYGIFAEGNRKEYSVANTDVIDDSPLEGKTIIFLGSSVTYGSNARGESFVDFLVKRDGITAVKEAVSGTLLVDQKSRGKESYISRMKTIDPGIQADAFVCQLSTNDATKDKELGTVSDGTELDDFDTQTVAGAIEYIIVYARETWNCPVIFFTGTKYDSENYGLMVELLLQIQEKWDIGVIDLWNDEEMNAVSESDYDLYMVNGIHPSRAGYREWWTPVFEEYLYDYLQ